MYNMCLNLVYLSQTIRSRLAYGSTMGERSEEQERHCDPSFVSGDNGLYL